MIPSRVFEAIELPDDDHKDLAEVMRGLIKGGKEINAENVYVGSNREVLCLYLEIVQRIDWDKFHKRVLSSDS